MQSYGHREEYWITVHGNGLAQVGESEVKLSCGSYVFIPKDCKHRLVNTDDKEKLIITEVQIGDYLGEDRMNKEEIKRELLCREIVVGEDFMCSLDCEFRNSDAHSVYISGDH